ncbi:MAG: SHOCT domain-containing protein [Clostridia bacterium]|nr:SHOCT domain-containing protein [Clostridia bacterium]
MVMRRKLDKKRAFVISCFFGGMYLLVVTIVGLLLYALELVEWSAIITILLGGVIIGIFLGVCLYFILWLWTNGFMSTDVKDKLVSESASMLESEIESKPMYEDCKVALDEIEYERIAKQRRKEKEDNLNALKTLLDNGIITQDEFEVKKKRILDL